MNDEQTDNVNETTEYCKLYLVAVSGLSDDKLKEYIQHWGLPYCINDAGVFAETLKNAVYIYSHQAKVLAYFLRRLDKIGKYYEAHTYDASSWFDTENLKIMITINKDFSGNKVYTTFYMDNCVYDDFLSHTTSDSNEMQITIEKLYFMHETPIFKYNTLPLNVYNGYESINSVLSRFSSASWIENVKKQTVLVAGIGGIGSWTAMLLSRMQPENIIMYDDDVVESVNMSGQLYSKNNIGLPKVAAMSDNIYSFSNYGAVVERNERFEMYTSPCDIMISGFDNMYSRKTFYNVWKRHVMSQPEEDRYKCLLIDGRLAAEAFQIYCIAGDDTVAMETYESTALFSEYEATNTICSYKQTSYMANLIAGAIVNLFTNFCANNAAEAPVRNIPYYTEYEGALMKLKTVQL